MPFTENKWEIVTSRFLPAVTGQNGIDALRLEVPRQFSQFLMLALIKMKRSEYFRNVACI